MNDIALLKLDKPLIFDVSVQPIDLAIEEVPVDSPVIISGWGRTSTSGPLPDHLKYNTLTALSQEDCAEKTGFDSKGLICLSHSRGNGACNVSSLNDGNEEKLNLVIFFREILAEVQCTIISLSVRQISCKAVVDQFIQMGMQKFPTFTIGSKIRLRNKKGIRAHGKT